MGDVLSTELFYGMILSGAKQVIHNENELNQLNVFPVADRDTGTNLATMMRYIVDNLSITKDTQELLHQLSQHGLVGSCGNSGLIFSQFFYGLTQHHVAEKTKVKLHDFVEMIALGYTCAYNSVSNPKPGTILTVMEKWVEGYRESLKNTRLNMVEGFKSSVAKAQLALSETMNQLEVLRLNNVVDAGAQGFVNFIEGMLKFLSVGQDQRALILAEQSVVDNLAQLSHEFEDVNELPIFRYCFETVIRAKDENALEPHKVKLEQMGDSIVIGRGAQLLKLHIHTNQPEAVTQLLAQIGDILYQKIDDMLMQYNIANLPRKTRVAIVADTMADLPLELIQAHNIYRIPLQVKINGNSFLDKFSISLPQTFTYLSNPENRIGTAAPSAALVARSFQFLQQHYESILVIPVGKALSSTYDVIVNQSRKYKDKLISVVDSQMNSAPLGLLVAYANQLAEAGISHDEIVVKLESARKETNVLIMLNSLDGLIRSGRLSKSMGFIARLLRLKPLLHMDAQTNKPKVIGAAFTRKGGWKKLTELLKKQQEHNKVKSIAVVHTDSYEHGEIFAKYVTRQTGLKPCYITHASSVSAIHTDKNSFAIGYINQTITL